MNKRAFDTMKNGYNRYQVDDYMQTQKLQTDALQKQLDAVNRDLETLKKAYAELDNKYCKVNENLKIKERAAGEMARMAMKEANMIVDTANQNADTIVKEALMMARGILLEISRLGDEANDMKSSMKEELRTIETALDEFETPAIPKMDLLKKDV